MEVNFYRSGIGCTSIDHIYLIDKCDGKKVGS
jgi:hypothetical protein